MQRSRFTRRLVILLLLSSVLSVLPSANSQQFTTTTSFLTSSTTQTLTSYSTSYYNLTSTSTATEQTKLQLASVQSCYEYAFPFNSTGNMHFSYVASGSMTIYLIDEGVVEFAALAGIPLAPLYAALRCDTADLTEMAHTTAATEFMNAQSVIISIESMGQPVSGSFSGQFDSFQNPWNLVVIAPLSNTNASLVLTYGPIVSVSSTPQTISFPLESVITSTTTVTLSTVLAVPFMQTYGGWIIAAIVAVCLIVAVIWLVLRRRPKRRRRTRRSR